VLWASPQLGLIGSWLRDEHILMASLDMYAASSTGTQAAADCAAAET